MLIYKRMTIILLCFTTSFVFGINNVNSKQLKTQDTIITKTDTLTNLTLKTILKCASRKFLWIKLAHEKIITVDKIYSNNVQIMKAKSRFIASMDALTTIRFNRLKIIENKIVRIKFSDFKRYGRKIEYDLFGKRLSCERIKYYEIVFEYFGNDKYR
jgi:hypothetical protein